MCKIRKRNNSVTSTNQKYFVPGFQFRQTKWLTKRPSKAYQIPFLKRMNSFAELSDICNSNANRIRIAKAHRSFPNSMYPDHGILSRFSLYFCREFECLDTVVLLFHRSDFTCLHLKSRLIRIQ